MSLLDDLIKKAGGKVPRASSAERDYEAQFGSTDLEKYTLPEDFQSYDTYGVQYDPKDPIGSAEARAQNQGYVDIIGKGLANIGVSFLKNVAETPAYLATIPTSPLVGIGTAMSGGNGWEAMGTYVFNNKYLETIQGIKDSIDENVLKIYVPPSVQEGGLWDKFTSMQNIVSQGSEMTGFVLSMYVPGAVVGKLGWGTKLVAGLNAAEAVGDVGLGTKAFNMLAKNFVKGSDAVFGEAGIGKILAGEARAGTVTGEALGIATNVDDAAKLVKGTAASAEAVVSNLDAAKKMLVYTNNAARSTDTGLAIAFNTTLESASEATQSYRDIYDAAKAKGYSEQDARNAAASGATNVFGANMSILAVTNIIGEKFILDGFERVAKGADNNKVAKMIINDAIGDKTSNITELLKHNWFNQSKFGKTLVGKALEPAAKVGGKFAIGAVKEGVVEEGMQTNVSQVAKADALKGEKTFQREGWTFGSSSILTFINGISNYGTLFSEKGNQELAESILMGGIFAGAIEFGGGAIRSLSGETKKANAARKAGYDDLRNNFIYSFKSHNEYFQREPEKNTDGTPNPKAGKLILDQQGRPVLTAEAEGNMKKTEAVRLAQAAHADIITALDPDSVEAEFANFMLEYNVFVDMLSREGGSELMKQAIDGGHLEALIAARYKANNEGTEIDPAMLTSMVARWKTLGKKTEDQLNFIRSTHSPEMYINYDKNDPKEVELYKAFNDDMFNERLSNLALHEHVKQVRTTRMKSYEDAVKEAAELQTKMDALSFNEAVLTPEQAAIKTEYDAAQKMFDDYEKQKPLFSDILSENEKVPADATPRIKAKYDKIKNKQKIANQGGFSDEMTQEELDFMDVYDKDAGKSQIDAANIYFATAKEVKKVNDNPIHAYTKTNSERKLTEMQISAAKEAITALEKDFETLNNTELDVAKKYKLVGPEFKAAWDKYKADKLKESQQAATDAKDAADMQAKTDGELASAGFDKDMRASIINHLIASGTAVNENTAKAAQVVFKDLEFTLNTTALQQEYNAYTDKTTEEAKKKLREIEMLTKLAAHPGGWAIVMVQAMDNNGRYIFENGKPKFEKRIISKRKAKYVGKVNDREATRKLFPLMFDENGNKLDEQEVANKREALIATNTAASIAQAAALVDQSKKFVWTTKDKTVERHMEIRVSNDTAFYSKAEVQKHISKFNTSSDYYSNINADGSKKFVKDAKGKDTKKLVENPRNARLRMDEASVDWDQMRGGFGPAIYVGRIAKRSLVLSMAPVNKNIVLASNKMKEALAQRQAMIKALEDVRKYNTNLTKSAKDKTATLQTRLNDLHKVQNTLTELTREARLLAYEIEGLTIKIANIETKKSGFKKQDGKFVKNAQSDIDKLNVLKEEKTKRLNEIPAIQQSLETEISNAIANINAIKKQIKEHQQEVDNLVAYNDAAGLLISTLKSLSEEDIYKLDPSDINSLLTSEGKDLLDVYYQQVKEDLTNKLIVNKTVDRIVIDKENELKIYNDSKQEFEKQLSNMKTFNEKLKAITTADVTSDTVDTLNNLLVTYLQIHNNTQYSNIHTALVTAIKDSTDKYIKYIEDLLVDIGHDRVIPNFNNAQVAQLKLRLEITLDKLRSIAVAPTVVEAYSSLADSDNYPAPNELQQAIVILGKQIEDFLDIDENLTNILHDLTAIYDFAIDLTKDTKKEIKTKIEATIKNIVDSRKEAEKIDVKIKDKIASLNSSINKVSKELQVLQNAAMTDIDFETGAIKTVNDEVVIENFRDLYLAELKAAKLAELSDIQKVAGDLQDPIKTTLDDLTKQRKELEKELLQSILSNKEVTATKKLTSFLQLIPQFEKQFNSDSAALLQTVRAVFSRSKTIDVASTASDKKDEEVLVSMLNPSTALTLLNRYIADFNVIANSENQISPITEAEYKAVVATFIDALDAGTKAATEGVLTKLRTTITSIDRVQSIAVDLASKLIVDMDRFSADIARRTQVALNKADRDNGDATYIDDEEIRVEGDDIAEYRQNRVFSTASSNVETSRNIGTNEQIDDAPKYIRADSANPNEYTISIAVHGEHYVVEKEDADKEAVYAPIELPKPPDGYDPANNSPENDEYKKKLELYYNAEDLSNKGLTEQEIAAITEFRRYSANNRFFTWTDANETIHKNIAGKKLFFRAATYKNIQDAAKTNPDLQSIIDDIDNQLKLIQGSPEQQRTANTLQGLIAGNNVILIPYEVVPGVNGEAPTIRPVKGLSSTEKRFNASIEKSNPKAKIEPRVLYSSRPLADTVYKSWNSTDKIVTTVVNANNELGTADFNIAKAEVETKLDIELVAPSSMALDDKEIKTLVDKYKVSITNNKNEVKILYTLDGDTKELTILNTQAEYKILHALGRDAFKLAVIGGVLKKIYTTQTKELIRAPQGNAYLQIIKINRGVPVYAQKRIASSNSKQDLKNAELTPVYMPLSEVLPNEPGLQLTVVTRKNAADHPNAIAGDLVVLSSNDLRLPVVTSLFSDETGEAKTHKANMLDVLGLTILKAVETEAKGDLDALRESVPFSTSKITPVKIQVGNEEVDINGYGILPTDMGQSRDGVGALNFYLNFGKYTESHLASKERNQIYIGQGDLVFVYNTRVNGVKTPKTTRIKLSSLIRTDAEGNRYVNLPALFENATNATTEGRALIELENYLNSKRINVHKKLLESSSGVTYIPSVKKNDAGNITTESTLQYTKETVPYSVWAAKNIVRTNHDPKAARRTIQRNLVHDTSFISAENAASLAADILKAEAAKEEARKKQEKENLAAYTTAAANAKHTYSTLAELKALLNTDVFMKSTLSKGTKTALKGVINLAATLASIDPSNIATLNSIGIYFSTSAAPITTTAAATAPVITGNTYSTIKELLDILQVEIANKTVLGKKSSTKALAGVLKISPDINKVVLSPEQIKLLETNGIYEAGKASAAPLTPPPPPPPAPIIAAGNPVETAYNHIKEMIADSEFMKLVDTANPNGSRFLNTYATDKDKFQTDVDNELLDQISELYAAFEQVKEDAAKTAATPADDDDGFSMSRFKDSTKKAVQLAEAKRNMSAIFGEKFADEEVSMIVGLIQGEGYGAFMEDGKILLSDIAETGTEYHEAFHRVWRMYIPTSKRAELIAEFETRADKEQVLATMRAAGYKGSREYLIEEALAEEFKLYSDKYKYKNGKLVPKDAIERWFDKLIKLLRALIGRPVQQQFYDDILAGKYKNVAPKYIYKAREPVYSKRIAFKDLPTIDVSSADINAVNTAITVELFQNELAKGNIHILLNPPANGWDTIDSYTKALVSQGTAVLKKFVIDRSKIVYGNYKDVYGVPASSGLSLGISHILSLINNDKLNATEKYYLVNSTEAVLSIANNGNLEIMIKELMKNTSMLQAGEQKTIANISEWTKKTTAERIAYFAVPGNIDKAVAAIGSIVRASIRSKLIDNPSVIALNTINANTTEKRWPTLDRVFSEAMKDRISPRPIDLTMLSVLQKHFQLESEKAAPSTEEQDSYVALLKVESYKNSSSFYVQWTKAIANIGGKLKYERNDGYENENDDETNETSNDEGVEEEGINTKEDEVVSKDGAYDKLVYEKNPLSSITTLIKLLIKSIPQKDARGNNVLHPTLGVVMAIPWESTINKFINSLANIPTWAMWNEFEKFVKMTPEVSSILKNIEEIKTSADKSDVKVKLNRAFGNHIYNFLITLINKDKIVTTSANSNTGDKRSINAWKNNMTAIDDPAVLNILKDQFEYAFKATHDPVLTARSGHSGNVMPITKTNELPDEKHTINRDKVNTAKEYAEYLGITLDSEIYEAEYAFDEGKSIYDTVKAIYLNAMDKMTKEEKDAVLRNPTQLANKIFGSDAEFGGTVVGTKIEALAKKQAKYSRDVSQSITSNNKKLFAANLNSAMTVTSDGLNYISSLEEGEVNNYIQDELTNRYQEYYGKEDLLTANAETWLEATLYREGTGIKRHPIHLARTKLMLLKYSGVFNSNSVSSVLLRNSITGSRIELSVLDSIKNTMVTVDPTNIDNISRTEIAAHNVNLAADGIVRVIQHADRSMAYGIKYDVASDNISGTLIQHLEAFTNTVLNQIADKSKTTATYTGKNIKNMATPNSTITPQMFGVLDELAIFLHETHNARLADKSKITFDAYVKLLPDLIKKYTSPEKQTNSVITFSGSIQIVDDVTRYIGVKQTEFMDDYVKRNLHLTKKIRKYNTETKKPTDMYVGRYISTKEYEKVEAAQEAVNKIINKSWAQMYLGHIEEVLLFSGNADLYGTAENMFKRMKTQSSTGIVSTATEEFLNEIVALNKAALSTANQSLKLDATPYTSPTTTKNFALIQEVIAKEEEFTNKKLGDEIYAAHYAYNYDLQRLLGKSSAEAKATAKRIAENMSKDFKDNINENDGQSWLNIFAYRQYLKSVDKRTDRHQQSFDFEMLVLNDMIRVKDNIAKGLTAEADITYTPFSVLVAQILHPDWGITTESYNGIVAGKASIGGELIEPEAFVDSINKWLTETREGFAPLKPQYTGPVWLDENHKTVDSTKKITVTGVRKTCYDVLLPSMLRGEEFTSRRKFADLMLNMHANGIDVLHMESAAKSGTKTPIPLWNKDANGTISTLNDNLYAPKNHTFLEWQYMKDQQNIDTEQKSKLKDSTQARKNMLANQTHRGVPIDFPMYTIDENGEKDYMKEDEWKAAWDNLSEQEKLNSSSLYTSFAAVIEVQNDLLLQAVEMLEEELKINSNNPVEVTKQIVKVLREAATKRESSDNILNAIESIIDHGWVDVLPNRNTIEPILMSLVSNNLITVKRFGNAVPQLASTGMDLVGTVRENNSATAELKTYQINENGETTPAEIITVLPKQYQKAVLAKYSKRAKRALTLFEAVEMLNEDMAREKDDPEYMEIEIFALRIPNQQMSSNDVFRVKQFYIGTKENFVYVPADIVVKVGSDFDIDKLQMYFPNMDKDFNEIRYEGGASSLSESSKTTFESEISDSELDAYMEHLMQTGQVEKEDCNKAEDGAVTANFTPGGKWETVKDLKGMPSHKEGGVDLQINKEGDVTFKNTSGAIITAAAGLVIPNIN